MIAPPETTDIQIADFDFNQPAVTGIHGPALPERHRGEGHDGRRLGVQLRDRCDCRVVEVHDQGCARHSAPAEVHRRDTSDGPPTAPLPTPPLNSATLTRPADRGAAGRGGLGGVEPDRGASPSGRVGWYRCGGTKVVVLRVKTKAYDLMIVEWSGAAPGDHAEYLVDPAHPTSLLRSPIARSTGPVSASSHRRCCKGDLLGDGATRGRSRSTRPDSSASSYRARQPNPDGGATARSA